MKSLSPPAVKCLIVFVTMIFLGFMIYYGAKAIKIQAGCVAMVQDLELNASAPCDQYPKASYVRVLCWHKTINDYLDQLPLKTTHKCHDQIAHARDEHHFARTIAKLKAGRSEQDVKDCESFYKQEGEPSSGICGHAQTAKEHEEIQREVEDALRQLGISDTKESRH
jgi:hypothetical protein